MPIEVPEDKLDDLIDDWSDSFLRDRLRSAKDRGGRASVAAAITEDRYGAGSAAARAALFILGTHGWQAALDFVADLEHHEGF